MVDKQMYWLYGDLTFPRTDSRRSLVRALNGHWLRPSSPPPPRVYQGISGGVLLLIDPLATRCSMISYVSVLPFPPPPPPLLFYRKKPHAAEKTHAIERMIIATRDVTRHDPRFTSLIRCPSSIREHRVIPIITCWKTSLKIWISRTYHVYGIDRAPLSRSTPVPFIDTVDKAIAVPNRGRIIDATAPPRVSPACLPSIESTRSNEPHAFSGYNRKGACRDYRRLIVGGYIR